MSTDELEAYVRAEIRALDSQIGHLCDRIAANDERIEKLATEIKQRFEPLPETSTTNKIEPSKPWPLPPPPPPKVDPDDTVSFCRGGYKRKKKL